MGIGLMTLTSLDLLPWSSSVLEEPSDVGLLPGLCVVFEAVLSSETLPLDVPLDDPPAVEDPADVGMLGSVDTETLGSMGIVGSIDVDIL